jgi:hypothetical protein
VLFSFARGSLGLIDMLAVCVLCAGCSASWVGGLKRTANGDIDYSQVRKGHKQAGTACTSFFHESQPVDSV